MTSWSQAVAHIHAPAGHRIATLITAHAISMAFKRMEPGEASVTISSRDPQANLDTLRMGNRLVMESPDYPPWVGPITLARESSESGMIDIGALGLPSLLDGRETAQGEEYATSTGSGAIFASVIRGANGQGYTGLGLPAVVPSGPAVNDLSIGGQSALDALNDLADRTGYEWWVDYTVSPAAIVATMRWGLTQGEDCSAPMHLYEGRHFSAFEYGIDYSQVKDSVSVIGGFDAISGRTSVTQRVGTASGSGAELVDERLRRAVLAYGAQPTQRVILDPTTTNPGELSRRGRSNLERSLSAAETFDITVNRYADWRTLWVGNHITLQARTTLGGDLSRVVRIVAAQPNHEAGRTNLSVEVAIR